jgi:hypothetical protein
MKPLVEAELLTLTIRLALARWLRRCSMSTRPFWIRSARATWASRLLRMRRNRGTTVAKTTTIKATATVSSTRVAAGLTATGCGLS